jgi:sialidase-1
MLKKILYPFLLIMAISGCKHSSQIGVTENNKPVPVFEPNGEYASMRIPALVMSKKGTLMAFTEARIGTSSDWADMDLLLRRSTDNGKTWQPMQVIAPRRKGEPTNNPTPIVGEDGTIHLLFARDYARAYYTRSADDGLTWTEPIDITSVFDGFRSEYNWNVVAPGPGHGIQLKNGRLLAPVWLARSATSPKRVHHPSCVVTVFSDDNGTTWQRGSIVADSSADVKNPNESMAVQLNDGRVMMMMRNPGNPHRKSITYSADGSSNWSRPVYHQDLFEIPCMASILRVSETKDGKGKNRIVFVSPDSEHLEKTPRRNLTAKLSYDEGKTFPVKRVLNPGASGYSDLAVGADGTIYCLYETNNSAGKDFKYTLVLQSFNIDWLTNGKDRLKK